MKSAFALFTALTICLLTISSTYAKDKNKNKEKARKPHNVLAEVTKVEADSISFFKVRKEDKTPFTVTVNDETKIEVNGEKATLADIKVGMTIIIDADIRDKKLAYTIMVKPPKNKKEKKKKAKPEEAAAEE